MADEDRPDPAISMILNTQEAKLKLAEFLKRNDCLYQVKRYLDLDIVGEDENKLIIYLFGLLSSTKYAFNIVVKGSSSAGKTHLVNSVLKLFPESWIYKIGGGSAKSLIYSDGNRNARILYLQEITGVGDINTETLKLTSRDDGGFSYAVVIKNKQTGEYETKEIQVGAKCFITTTTRFEIDPELETRTLYLEIDESKEQTRRILDFKGFKVANSGFASENIPFPFEEEIKNIARFLPRVDNIHIPFASEISKTLPDDILRSRRDIDTIFNIMRASALFHWTQRPLAISKEDGHVIEIVVHPMDYVITKILAKKAIENTLSGLHKRELEVYQACLQVEEITTSHIANMIKVPERTVRQALKALANRGFLIEDEDKSKSNKKVYMLSGKRDDYLVSELEEEHEA